MDFYYTLMKQKIYMAGRITQDIFCLNFLHTFIDRWCFQMRQTFIIGLLFFGLCSQVVAQSFTDSNLPIVIINTDNGWNIEDEPRILASMKIIYRGPGERNYFSDRENPDYLNYDGRIDIEIRGSSSQYFSKKQYGFSTRLSDDVSRNNVSLLGMPEEHDWILNGMVYDTAMIRDYLCYNLYRQLGNYASRTAYCELFINNHYRGIYLLEEKIKADKERVDVIKITSNDNNLPYVSGGYITKADKVSPGESIAWTMFTWYGAPVNYLNVLPKPENVTPSQFDYIRIQFEDMEATARNKDVSLETGFPSIIDIPSFIDHFIISELSSNPDAYQFSTYFHKDRKGKLRAGPIWDSDLTFGNDLFFWGFDRSKTAGWHFEDGQNDGSTFWRDLFYSDEFQCYLSLRWNELIQPGGPLNIASLEGLIDSTVSLIGEAVARDYVRWSIEEDYQQLISDIKSFIVARTEWMTANLGSFAACRNVPTPPLVINRIMYNPETSLEFPVSNEMEFIEILNNGDQTVDLTGIYFRGTGLAYQFPAHATLGPQSSYHLASSWPTFQARYGFAPYGAFTRHLSNKEESLVLADGFGNIIDNVHYYDTLPWPEADGNGYYLALIDPGLDNSLPEHWMASKETVVSKMEFHSDGELTVFPNPVHDIMRIQADSEIRSLSLFDIQGRLLRTIEINGLNAEVDISHFSKGTYILEITCSEKIYTRLIVKL